MNRSARAMQLVRAVFASPPLPGGISDQVVGTGSAAKMETWASSGNITPRTFWSVRRWTHEAQLSK